MSVTIGEYVFLAVLWLIAAQFLTFAAILSMHFLMPKVILQTYFKPPYFREAECHLFTGIPYSPLRTVMLMTVLAFPSRGKKRNLTQAYKLAPTWYRKASAFIICITVALSIAIPTLLFGLYFYDKCITAWCV
jgi:hypothetical protein